MYLLYNYNFQYECRPHTISKNSFIFTSMFPILTYSQPTSYLHQSPTKIISMAYSDYYLRSTRHDIAAQPWENLLIQVRYVDTQLDERVIPYSPFHSWEIRRHLFAEGSFHLYNKWNGRFKSFTSLHQLLPHVTREDLLLLYQQMKRHYTSQDEFHVGGRDVYYDLAQLFQDLDEDQTRIYWQNQDEWIVRKWTLYPRSSVHKVHMENSRYLYMFAGTTYPAKSAFLEQMLGMKLHVLPSNNQNQELASSVIRSVQADILNNRANGDC